MILGIVGKFAAGKDTAAEFFVKNGFKHYSCSDIIREEHVKRYGVPAPDREAQVKMGDLLRSEGGNAVLAKRILEQIQSTNPKHALVVSIRTPEELSALRSHPDFKLIAIDAPITLRYQRSVERKGEKDHISFEEFKAQEERESKSIGTAMNLNKVIGSADHVVTNQGTVEELHDQLKNFI